MRPFAFVVLVVAASALLGCQRAGTGPPVREVRIALSRDAITWLPVLLAQSRGYYKEEGLSLAVSDVAGLSKGWRRSSAEVSTWRVRRRCW